MKPSIAVLNVVGDLDFAATQQALHALRETQSRYGSRVLLLRVNSMGGTLAAAQELVEGIDALRAEGVWVIACCGDMVQSAALHLAACADHVLAQRGSVLGGVGAVMRSRDYGELLNKLGVRETTFSSGSAKDPASACAEGPARDAMQALVDQVAEQFSRELQARRSLSCEVAELLRDGRSLTGDEALRIGLIDEIGGYWRALTMAADRLHTETPRLIHVNDTLRVRLPWYLRLLPEPVQRLYQPDGQT